MGMANHNDEVRHQPNVAGPASPTDGAATGTTRDLAARRLTDMPAAFMHAANNARISSRTAHSPHVVFYW
ncbi:MAG: hypothetical protein CTY20_05615 [Hyphomicrobium sp.]|nr:MAG: hypothetical protein CTY20_05615 [Hyphomicrobium sp.]